MTEDLVREEVMNHLDGFKATVIGHISEIYLNQL